MQGDRFFNGDSVVHNTSIDLLLEYRRVGNQLALFCAPLKGRGGLMDLHCLFIAALN